VALNAVMPYMRGIIDGLAIPGGGAALKAYITPPMSKTLDSPIAFLLPSPTHGKRQTSPRGAGFMEIEWWFDIYLKFLTNPNSANLDSQFPLIVDAILYAYWGTRMPVQITDAVTARTSGILAVGEEFEYHPTAPEAPASYRMLLFDSLLRIQVKELIQA
jgi:hypothetical protein